MKILKGAKSKAEYDEEIAEGMPPKKAKAIVKGNAKDELEESGSALSYGLRKSLRK